MCSPGSQLRTFLKWTFFYLLALNFSSGLIEPELAAEFYDWLFWWGTFCQVELFSIEVQVPQWMAAASARAKCEDMGLNAEWRLPCPQTRLFMRCELMVPCPLGACQFGGLLGWLYWLAECRKGKRSEVCVSLDPEPFWTGSSGQWALLHPAERCESHLVPSHHRIQMNDHGVGNTRKSYPLGRKEV